MTSQWGCFALFSKSASVEYLEKSASLEDIIDYVISRKQKAWFHETPFFSSQMSFFPVVCYQTYDLSFDETTLDLTGERAFIKK